MEIALLAELLTSAGFGTGMVLAIVGALITAKFWPFLSKFLPGEHKDSLLKEIESLRQSLEIERQDRRKDLEAERLARRQDVEDLRERLNGVTDKLKSVERERDMLFIDLSVERLYTNELENHILIVKSRGKEILKDIKSKYPEYVIEVGIPDHPRRRNIFPIKEGKDYARSGQVKT